MKLSKIANYFRIHKNLLTNPDYRFSKISGSNYLASLCEKYGSDKDSVMNKNLLGWPAHNYAAIYEFMFRDSRYSVKSLFECGIGTNNLTIKSNMGTNGMPGASLRVWQDYFPDALIFGGDIDESILFSEDRIKTFHLDQTNPASIAKFFNLCGEIKFDLMIDDGLHEYEAGITLFKNSFSYLSRFGTYIIEDVKHSDINKYRDYFKFSGLDVTFVLDANNLAFPGLDHNYLILIKGSNL